MPPGFSRFERGFPGFQQVVQDIVPSGCGLQIEVRKHGLQLLISTFWRRIWRASVSALRVRAAISESSGLRDENRSDRSPTTPRPASRPCRPQRGWWRDAVGAVAAGSRCCPAPTRAAYAGAGRRCLGVEQERTAEPPGASPLCEVEMGDSACGAPPAAPRSAHRKASATSAGPNPGRRGRPKDGGLPNPPPARCRRSRDRGTPHGRSAPEARPGRAERVESGAPGGQREVEHPQRVGRQEAAAGKLSHRNSAS